MLVQKDGQNQPNLPENLVRHQDQLSASCKPCKAHRTSNEKNRWPSLQHHAHAQNSRGSRTSSMDSFAWCSSPRTTLPNEWPISRWNQLLPETDLKDQVEAGKQRECPWSLQQGMSTLSTKLRKSCETYDLLGVPRSSPVRDSLSPFFSAECNQKLIFGLSPWVDIGSLAHEFFPYVVPGF